MQHEKAASQGAKFTKLLLFQCVIVCQPFPAPSNIGGLLIWRSPRLARIIDAVPQHWLIGVQLYRALGVIFLILYVAGKLLRLLAWPAGLGEDLVGVLAPVVAIAYRRGPRENPDLVSAWNLFGLVDLIVAVTAGMLSSPSPLQLFVF